MAKQSDSSRFVRTTPNMQQGVFLQTSRRSQSNPIVRLEFDWFEYDSDSSNEEDSATHEEDAVEAVPVNFLSKTVRTRTGRQITLSYRALSSYWGTKSYFFLQKPLKTRVNSKYQSKGSTYILHLLAFVEIRLFNVFFWERKAGFGKLRSDLEEWIAP